MASTCTLVKYEERITAPTILQIPIYQNSQIPDQPIWKPNASGTFTCASAWEVVRTKRPILVTNHKKIPFRWSFCLWRALRNKLPTNDRVARFGPPSVNRCVCCINSQAESVDHIFSRGHFAKAVWKIFTGPAGLLFEEMSLQNLLMKWWIQKPRNEIHKLLLDTFPIIICWNLWKSRCGAKYGTKHSSMVRVVFSINSNINLLLKTTYPNITWPSKWSGICTLTESLNFLTKTTQVCWQRPTLGLVKINSDGSALSNPGRMGAGAIIKNHQGDFIHAIASPLGEGTNNLAETEAAFLGVKWCIDNGFSKVHLEADSALLIHWLTSSATPPWTLAMHIHKLKELCQQCESIYYSHVYIEGNAPADFLSKLSHDLHTITCRTSLPTSEVKSSWINPASQPSDTS
ncbi:PREDICTED: uncharacterized protein LOC109231690 [Nicotiana attenuata]|uniref:uncharacterized protein LOC109231690 n=1 Tax=Nicotiana attenuata TaxID=49451 RepID=UPI000905454F|nr:PREDICTED: uncharacterized protein LOC109231690 [Nicotiana attenuata]